MENLEEQQPSTSDFDYQLAILSRSIDKSFKFENPEEEEDQQSTSDDQLAEERTTNIPEEIISEILSRLPVKTILKFRSVSKPWISLISHPSFNKLQFTNAAAARRTALLISAYDTSKRQRFLLSFARDGGPVTHRFTPYARTITCKETTQVEHLNGLVLFTSGNGFIEHNFAYILNPSTRNIFQLNGPASEPVYVSYGKGHICYFFGYDESTNEHKVLTIRMFDFITLKPFQPAKIEIMIYSMSSLSWRKIDVDLPCDIVRDWNVGIKHGVCVNSVIHLILQNRDQILAFDLRTETFSIINLPGNVNLYSTRKRYCWKGLNLIISNQPFLMKINGFLGVIYQYEYRNRGLGVEHMGLWTLKDYENRVWGRASRFFSNDQFVLDGPFPLNPFIRKDNMVRADRINVPIYDVEKGSMMPVEFTLGYELLRLGSVRFDHVRSYTESILPLPRN